MTHQTVTHQHDHDPNVRQAMASNPESSVWVSASAGTGKTKILTDRVLRLMLPNPQRPDLNPTAPDKILCLTYTKTAASEMAERIHEKLSEWAVMSDNDLVEKLTNLLRVPPTEDIIRTARSLFAKVVDTPGGMKIMTIHSFCQSVLKRFPLEAGLPAHFEVLDERTAQDYMMRATRRIISKSKKNPKSDLSRAFDTLSVEVNADQFNDLMKDITQNRSVIKNSLKAYSNLADMRKTYLDRLGCDIDDTPQSIIDNAVKDAAFKIQTLRSAVPILLSGSKTDAEKGTYIQHFVEQDERTRTTHFESYCRGFISKSSGDLYAKPCTKGIVDKNPDIAEALIAEGHRLLEVLDKIKSVQIARYSFDVMVVGRAIVEAYEAIKSSHIQLDYDDLIFYTEKLLSNPGQASWVLYKMDQGIDHILLDEAQDTSPSQWEIIRAIANDFFDGASARDDIERTLFVVGDEKQSIFSFQGADPKGFKTMRDYFSARIQNAGHRFQPVNMLMSFRSTPAVLSSVDHVFSAETVKQGVQAADGGAIEHLPFRAKDGGMVEVWPVISGEDTDDIEPWTPPIHPVSTESATVKLAFKIAETISDWIRTKQTLESKGRPITAGDIMILFRTRKTPLFNHTVRALKQYNVPISGVDRLVLTDDLAVKDCLIAAECALLPEDDLSLATFLKTPLIGYDEDKLFGLAHDRSGSLWSNLRDYDPVAYQYIASLIRDAETRTPYMFFQNLLIRPTASGASSGRKALFGRLGLEIEDALDEFLNIAIDFERLHIPHIQSFLSWFKQGEAEIKREQESSAQDQVRLMTVHASKGLQAPIVFLPDTVSKPKDYTMVIWPDKDSNHGLPLWAPREEHRNTEYKDMLQSIKSEALEEYRRLLYVALTRAEDRLYIAGAKDNGKVPDDTWYQICHSMMSNKPNTSDIAFRVGDQDVIAADTGKILTAIRYTSPQLKTPDGKSEDTADRGQVSPLPDYFSAPPAAEPVPPRPLSPSRPVDIEPAVRSPLDADDSYRFARGNLVHRLLEILPQINPEGRQAAISKYLSNPTHDLTSEQQSDLSDEILAILNDRAFAPIFGPNSRAEVSVVGLLEKGDVTDFYALSAQIDRMVIEDDRILIVDYKTNRPPPQRPEDVADVYIKQLKAYKIALSKIYPDRQIECALLWTDGPNLMPIDI